MHRVLTEKQQYDALNYLGDIRNTLDANKISYMFARFKDTGIRYYVTDIITIGPSESEFVKPGTKTTIGIYIANKFIYEGVKIFGYINKNLDKDLNEKIDKMLAKALLEYDISWDQYVDYIDRVQWLYGGPLALIINTSLSQTILSLPPKAKKRREELLKEHEAELKANDPQVATKIEHEVVDIALEEMRKTNDPSLSLFDSGCGIKPYNQYKTICVMKGAIQDNTGESPTGYKIVTSNYDTGITKEDMPKIADAVVTTAYSSGVETQFSGTNGKKYNALFQRIRVQDRNSDCGSTTYLSVPITKNNHDRYIYRWMKDGKNLHLILPGESEALIGKTIEIRTPVHCHAKDPEYCAKCIGDRPYRVGIKNIGFTFMAVSGSTLNASLKKKHDVSLKFQHITEADILKYVK